MLFAVKFNFKLPTVSYREHIHRKLFKNIVEGRDRIGCGDQARQGMCTHKILS